MTTEIPSDFLHWRKIQGWEKVWRAGSLLGGEKQRCRKKFPSTPQTDMGRELLVTRGREVGGYRVQVSFAGSPRHVSVLWKEGIEVHRCSLQI